MIDLNEAKEKLLGGGYTCVFYNGAKFFTFTERGVKPLVSLLEKGVDCRDFCAADKIVGRAAAFLYAALGVKAVFACVITKSAITLLNDFGITVEYGKAVVNVINRQGSGICPFDAAVLGVNDLDAACRIICEKSKKPN